MSRYEQLQYGALRRRLEQEPSTTLVMSMIFGAVLIASLLLQVQSGAVLIFGLVLLGIARGSMMALAMQALMETPGVPRAQLGLAGGCFLLQLNSAVCLVPSQWGCFLTNTQGFIRRCWCLRGWLWCWFS